MDLPEKLQQKIASRIGNNRLVYEPYNREQITEIINSRIGAKDESTSIFDKQAVNLLASKVSSYSGDIRRSLQVAKRALELTRDEYYKTYKGDMSKKLINVSYKHVISAFEDLYNTKQTQLLKSLRKYEVLVVIGVFLEQIKTKNEKVSLEKLQDRCDAMLMKINWFADKSGSVTTRKKIPSNTFREVVKRLQSFGLLNVTVD